jgi:hypothetical protein
MDAQRNSKQAGRFIGMIEHAPDGWRVSFRLKVPNDVFTQQGNTEVFPSEVQASKWLHTQANAHGFSFIEMKRELISSQRMIF